MTGSRVVARADGVLGELALRRRGDVCELFVNGTLVMDTVDASTERLLASTVLDRHAAPERVLVGGLGLGFTVAELLADPRLARVDVVEIEPVLVEWLRSGLLPGGDRMLADPRVRMRVADVRQVLSEPGAYDAVLLDVDNGPGFLVHSRNASVYAQATLAAASRVLRPGGLLAVWSAARAPRLRAALTRAVGPTEEIVRWVRRQGRDLDYYLYLAAAATAASPRTDRAAH